MSRVFVKKSLSDIINRPLKGGGGVVMVDVVNGIYEFILF